MPNTFLVYVSVRIGKKNFGKQLLMTINEIWPSDKNLM